MKTISAIAAGLITLAIAATLAVDHGHWKAVAIGAGILGLLGSGFYAFLHSFKGLR